MTFEEYLRVCPEQPENHPPFSFRQYLSYFGITEEKDVQFHMERVLRMEKITGRKMRLEWDDPYKEERT